MNDSTGARSTDTIDIATWLDLVALYQTYASALDGRSLPKAVVDELRTIATTLAMAAKGRHP